MKLAPMTTRGVRRLGALDDGAAVGERAQRVDMRLVGAGNRQPHRLGAGRQQQPVVGERCRRPASDDSRAFSVDRRDFGR